jgi:hypothetical protein
VLILAMSLELPFSCEVECELSLLEEFLGRVQAGFVF